MENNKSAVKILVVDDVEVNLIILEEIIKNMGYEAITAMSVKDAFEVMQEQQVLPQIILSDILLSSCITAFGLYSSGRSLRGP